MEKSIQEWERRLRGQDDKATLATWKSKCGDDLAWKDEPFWFAAVAERMRRLANMAIDLEDDTRKTLGRRAEEIYARLERTLDANDQTWAQIAERRDDNTVYFEKFGTRTARYYMYERGAIDILGEVLERA